MNHPQSSRTSCRFANPLAGGNAYGPAKPVPWHFAVRSRPFKRWSIWTIQLMLVAAYLFVLSAPARAERLKELASVQGVRDNPIIGYGLMVGLDGTGGGVQQRGGVAARAVGHGHHAMHGCRAARHGVQPSTRVLSAPWCR